MRVFLKKSELLNVVVTAWPASHLATAPAPPQFAKGVEILGVENAQSAGVRHIVVDEVFVHLLEGAQPHIAFLVQLQLNREVGGVLCAVPLRLAVVLVAHVEVAAHRYAVVPERC